ncbi:MAG: DnaK suppressor protein, partial [Chloroflexota bacterium]|nr:DnaK suppressor protein [Chloroflexota bacterium]
NRRIQLLSEASALAGREQADETALKLDGSGADQADVATEAFEQELAAGLERAVRAQLDDIDAAIARLEIGEYGICEECKQPINPERLAALPRARRCLNCQQAAETAMKFHRLRKVA